MSTSALKRLLLVCVLGAGLLAMAWLYPAHISAAPGPAPANAPSLQATCALGADIDLTAPTTSPLPQITSTTVVEGAGYAVDDGGDWSVFRPMVSR